MWSRFRDSTEIVLLFHFANSAMPKDPISPMLHTACSFSLLAALPLAKKESVLTHPQLSVRDRFLWDGSSFFDTWW